MILAAGLGTRLHPLTDDRPKALVEIYGTPLLELAINRLVDAGAAHIVVNVHHFADMVEDFIASRQWPCRISISDERAMLLDTGGALRHAAPLFERREPVLVHNVDVLSRIDLRDLVRFHSESHNQATLCVSRRSTRRLLAFETIDLKARAPVLRLIASLAIKSIASGSNSKSTLSIFNNALYCFKIASLGSVKIILRVFSFN